MSNSIDNNTCNSNAETGIYVSLDLNSVSGNTCQKNFWGIFLDISNHNTIINNSCNLNYDFGIRILDSNHNMLRDNTISRNTIGIHLSNTSKNNVAHYNDIDNNTAFGLHVAFEGNTIDAKNNWWGANSGPYHPWENHRGKGDNVSDSVLFLPWLNRTYIPDNEKPDGGESEVNELNLLCFSSLLLILITLIGLLFFAFHAPEKQLAQKRNDSDFRTGKGTSSRVTVNKCPHCSGKFEVESAKRPIKFNCYFCHKEIEFR